MSARSTVVAAGSLEGDVDLGPYLPSTLVESALHHPEPAWWEWLEGSLMHCDISGFTAMSESLAAKGREGAELMVGVLNGFFESMLEIAAGYGGVQMKFGGDAMLLYFGGEGHAVQAAACGLAMQRAMAPFRRVRAGGQEHALRMRAGVHSGRFFAASVGDPSRLMHYVLTGDDVSRAAIVEEHTKLGQVWVSGATARALGESARSAPRDGGLFAVTSVAGVPKAAHETARPAGPVAGRFLSAPVREGMTRGAEEHRRVTPVFINVLGVHETLRGAGERATFEALNAFVSLLTDTLDRHGGYLLGSDVAGEGDKFIGLFGAPVAAIKQEAAAMSFALDLRDDARRAGLPLRMKTGINTAYVFAGEVGSRRRREYTVIGDGVNLSARLMAAASPGEIIVSRATAEAAAGFALRKLRPIRVKGKKEPAEIRRLTGRAEPVAAAAVPLVGRQREMARLMQAAASAGSGSGRVVRVWGEPGIGKSRIAAELMERVGRRGWKVLGSACYPHTRGTPFGPWRTLLGGAAVQEAAAEQAASLLNEMDRPANEGADPRARRESIVAGLVEVLRTRATMGPSLLVIEDVHWADESSSAVLDRLAAAAPGGLLTCVTSLEGPPAGSREMDFRLGELSEEAARRIVSGAIAGERSVAAVIEKARGNPLFLSEFVRAGGAPDAVPDSLNDLMTARIDELDPDERQVLRAASVAGTPFETAFVDALAGELPAGRVTTILPGLVEAGFTREEGGHGVYSFTHALLSEVAYESAPFAWRRRMHAKAGTLIEEEYRGQDETVSETLLHHFERAGDDGKAVRYAAISGDRSARVFANQDAIAYFERGLAAVRRLGTARADGGLLLERIGDMLELTGRHHEAGERLQEALEVLAEAPRQRPRHVPWTLYATTREASLCRKIAAATEHASDYDEALVWLKRAREALPARNARLRAQVQATTCSVLFRKGRYAEAMEWGRQAVRTARAAADLRQVAYSQNMMATALIEAGRLREAMRYLRAAVKAYHELGDYAGQGSANNNLGSAYQLLGVYDAALYHYGVALVADERTGDSIDAAIVHNNMAETLLLLDREQEALERLRDVLRIATAEPDLEDLGGWAHVTTARALRATGEFRQASRHLQEGVRTLRRVGSLGLLTEATVDLAEQALAEGDVRLARRRGLAAIRRAREIDSRLAEARARRVLGECELLAGRTREGERLLLAALEECRRISAEYEEARTAVVLARNYLGGGRAGSARRMLRQAHRFFSRCGASRQAAAAAAMLEEAA